MMTVNSCSIPGGGTLPSNNFKTASNSKQCKVTKNETPFTLNGRTFTYNVETRNGEKIATNTQFQTLQNGRQLKSTMIYNPQKGTLTEFHKEYDPKGNPLNGEPLWKSVTPVLYSEKAKKLTFATTNNSQEPFYHATAPKTQNKKS